MRRQRRWPGRSSLINRISLNMLVLIIVLTQCLFIGCIGMLWQINVSNARATGQNLLSGNVRVVQQYFEDIDTLATSLIFNTDINNALKSQSDSVSDMATLRTAEQIIYHARPDVEVVFYKENKPRNAYSIYNSSEPSAIEDFHESEWYRELCETGKSRILLTNIKAQEDSSLSYVHSLIYKVQDLYENTTIGYLRLDLNLSELEERLLLNYVEVEGVEILSPTNRVLFGTGTSFAIPESFLDGEGVHALSERGGFLFAEQVENCGWTVAIRLSKEGLYRNSLLIGGGFLLGLVLSLAICLTIMERNMRILNDGLSRLQRGMKDLQEGNLGVRVVDEEHDEIGEAIARFNQMAARIQTLVRQVESKQALLKDAQIQTLQQQINPHFIYNTLETMMGMASEGMNDEIIELCSCMSEILHYNTAADGTGTIGEEIRQIRNYTHIMELRMGDRFHTEIAVDADCRHARIVRFCLQPLVENAIMHGLADTVSNGRIRVEVLHQEDEIALNIRDNGKGISEETFAQLRAGMEVLPENGLREIERTGHKGLLNVHFRMKLLYEDRYRIWIDSRPGEGTGISMRIPYQTQEDAGPEAG